MMSQNIALKLKISLFSRALRNEHRKKLLLLTSDKSLEGKLLSFPDLPLKTTRMFSTKALKMQTQKKMQSLTEVQQKKKEENNKNLKRKNRLMTEIFNKVCILTQLLKFNF
jgi:ALMS motif